MSQRFSMMAVYMNLHQRVVHFLYGSVIDDRTIRKLTLSMSYEPKNNNHYVLFFSPSSFLVAQQPV